MSTATAQQRLQAIELLEQDKTPREIAKSVGVTLKVARFWKKHYPNKVKYRAELSSQDKEFIKVWANAYTVEEVADHFGITTKAAIRWRANLKGAGIPMKRFLRPLTPTIRA